MSGGAIAALIAAGAFVLLVLLLAIPLLKLGRTLDEATLAIRTTHEGLGPLLTDAQATLGQVNTELVQVESIAQNVNSMTTNVAALTSVVSATLGNPLIKVAAFSYGVRSATKKKREGQALAEAAQRDKDARRARRAARRAA